MSWKKSTLWAFAVISVVAAIVIIFPGLTENTATSNTLQQSSPRYKSHIITGDIYLNGQPLKSATVMFYKQDNINEMVIDKSFSNGRYTIDISYLSSGWEAGEAGVIEVQVAGQHYQTPVILTAEPVQTQNIVIY